MAKSYPSAFGSCSSTRSNAWLYPSSALAGRPDFGRLANPSMPSCCQRFSQPYTVLDADRLHLCDRLGFMPKVKEANDCTALSHFGPLILADGFLDLRQLLLVQVVISGFWHALSLSCLLKFFRHILNSFNSLNNREQAAFSQAHPANNSRYAISPWPISGNRLLCPQ